jgi:hypothetical protein
MDTFVTQRAGTFYAEVPVFVLLPATALIQIADTALNSWDFQQAFDLGMGSNAMQAFADLESGKKKFKTLGEALVYRSETLGGFRLINRKNQRFEVNTLSLADATARSLLLDSFVQHASRVDRWSEDDCSQWLRWALKFKPHRS